MTPIRKKGVSLFRVFEMIVDVVYCLLAKILDVCSWIRETNSEWEEIGRRQKLNLQQKYTKKGRNRYQNRDYVRVQEKKGKGHRQKGAGTVVVSKGEVGDLIML